MTEQDIKEIHELFCKPEPELAICMNPLCLDAFTAKDATDVFCPECDCHLHEVEKFNIAFAIEHGIAPEAVTGEILNGGQPWGM